MSRRRLPSETTLRLTGILVLTVAAMTAMALVWGPHLVAITLAGGMIVAVAVARLRQRQRGKLLHPDMLDIPETTIDLRAPVPRITTNDPVTGLVDQMHFRATLTQRVAAARRHLQPLSLVVFELDGFEGAATERREQAMRLLGSVMRRTLRECDIACRFSDAAVATILEDTPEVGAASAAERVRRAITATPTGRAFTLSAGIACYPSHALDAHELLRRSVRALAAARAAGRDRVEIAGGD
jgi:diguanylate cyclase (GGDEF)-like protein